MDCVVLALRAVAALAGPTSLYSTLAYALRCRGY